MGNFLIKHMLLVFLAILSCQFSIAHAAKKEDPLPSWTDSSSKKYIIQFVRTISTEGSKNFVPPASRIAVFDNDGTLWAEQPYYFQLSFTIDRVKALSSKYPEWKEVQPFKAALEEDFKTLIKGGKKSLLELVQATHSGVSEKEFARIARDWLSTARHPETGRLYTEMVYQPMLDLLNYLRANGFKTYIVSAGGLEFMRVFAKEVYGIPPEQVIGSSIKTEFIMSKGKPKIFRTPDINFINDKGNKAVAISQQIGRRPLAAFGNSDGDLQMLQWTMAGDGLRLAGLIHHTDAKREWAYDRSSPIGLLDKALDEAKKKGWIIVDMKKDWEVIFPTRSK